jgi:hypothetical protein
LGSYGLLIDFKFKVNPEIDRLKRSKEIQQLSLSLDSSGKRNLAFYAQRFKYITHAIEQIRSLFPIAYDASQIELGEGLAPLHTFLLPEKKYEVGAGNTADTPFQGIKKFGPYAQIESRAQFHFLFRDEDRDLAIRLYKALKGETFPSIFDGIERYFRIPFSNDLISHQRLQDLEPQTIRAALEEIKRTEIKPSIVLAVFPKDEELYYRFKRDCLELGLLEQVTTIPLLRLKDSLKWSVANIALGIFTKLGGIPWLLVSKDQRLIVGIGKAMRSVSVGDTREIKKFFSYSVLTESTGRYISLEVLANCDNDQDYLAQLNANVKQLLLQQKGKYREVVLHVPYRIKKTVFQKLREAVRSASESLGQEVLLCIVRVNPSNKFFGYDITSNSLVPLDGSVGILSNSEFLGWYAGLDRKKPIVNKQIPGPVYVSIDYSSRSLSDTEKHSLLHDLNNLAAANWRGFNGKVTPVSIYYCKIVADLIEKFDQLSLGPIPAISNLKPWFL